MSHIILTQQPEPSQVVLLPNFNQTATVSQHYNLMMPGWAILDKDNWLLSLIPRPRNPNILDWLLEPTQKQQ